MYWGAGASAEKCNCLGTLKVVRKILSSVTVAALLLAVVAFSVPGYTWASEKGGKLPGAQVMVAQADDEDVSDPLEPVNRAIFQFNEFIQDILLGPIARLYNENLPAVFRAGVSNFLSNLATPVTVANNLLQGDTDGTVIAISRFVTNSTVGIAGIADVAAELGVEARDEDFGQTLGVWGFGEGFYLVLPIFGPSNPRDAVGKFVVDPYFSVSGHWLDNTDNETLEWTLTAVDGISEYADVVDELDQVRKTSVDYYAAIRSLYRQKRKAEINNGETLELPPIPDLGYDMVPEDFNQPLAGRPDAVGVTK